MPIQKTENGRNALLKGIKINKFKTVLSSGKNISIGVLRQMGSIFEVTEV